MGLRKLYDHAVNAVRTVSLLGNFAVVVAYAFYIFGVIFVFPSSTLRAVLLVGAAIGAVASYGITPSRYKEAGRKSNAQRSVRYFGYWAGSLILFALTVVCADAQMAREYPIVLPVFEFFATAPIVFDVLVLLEGFLVMYFLVGGIVLPVLWKLRGRG